MTHSNIQPQELHSLRASGRTIDLIDVRGPSEYAEVHAEGAVLVPLETVSPQTIRTARQLDDPEPVYIICRSGGRSRSACERLAAAGIKNLVNVEGGTLAWERSGLPVVRQAGGGGGGIRRFLRPVMLLLVAVFLILGFTGRPWFTLAAAGTWIALIVAGGGCCPLSSCALPSSSSSSGSGCCDNK